MNELHCPKCGRPAPNDGYTHCGHCYYRLVKIDNRKMDPYEFEAAMRKSGKKEG